MGPKKSVPELLREAASIYEQRSKVYGDNYKLVGTAFASLFPKGVELHTPTDFNRFALFNNCLMKLSRYAQQFAQGGHADSLDDLSVYAMMLREIDNFNDVRIHDVSPDVLDAAFAKVQAEEIEKEVEEYDEEEMERQSRELQRKIWEHKLAKEFRKRFGAKT